MYLFILTLFLILVIWNCSIQKDVTDIKNVNQELKRMINSLSHKISKLQKADNTVNENIKPQAISTEGKAIEELTENVNKQEEEAAFEEAVVQQQYSSSDKDKSEYYIEEEKINTFKKEVNNDFEHVFLGNIFIIVGAIAIIIASGYFISVFAGQMSALIKALIGIIAGAGMIAAGLSNKTESLKRFSSVLTGTGFSVLFITVYCATVLSHTFSIGICSLFGLLIFILAYFVADKQKSDSLVAIAMVGGYLNIAFTATQITWNMLFIYLVFLNAISLVFVFKNNEKSIINYVNLGLSAFVILMFAVFYYSEITMNCLIYPIILWLIYTAYDVISRLKIENYDNNGVLSWINYAVLTFFSLIVCKFNYMHAGGFQLIMIIMFCLLTCLFMVKTTDKYKIYLRLMLSSIFLTIMFTTHNSVRIGILSFGAIILSYLSSTYNRQYLAKWAIGYLSVAIVNIFIFNADMQYGFNNANYHPVFNMRALCFMAPVLASIASYLIINKMTDVNCKKMASYLKFCAISLLYIFVCFEINDFLQYKFGNSDSVVFLSCMTYAIIGCIYTLQMSKLGEIYNNLYYKFAGNVIYLTTLLFLLILGSKYTPVESFIPLVNIRCIAYIVAIAASLLLGKWTKQNVYKYMAIILGFVLITAETNDYISKINAHNLDYIISVFWIIYAGIITWIGIFKDIQYLKISGIWVTILAIIKIVFFDMINVDIAYRMIVFIMLGAVLMIVSYYYNKKQK